MMHDNVLTSKSRYVRDVSDPNDEGIAPVSELVWFSSLLPRGMVDITIRKHNDNHNQRDISNHQQQHRQPTTPTTTASHQTSASISNIEERRHQH